MHTRISLLTRAPHWTSAEFEAAVEAAAAQAPRPDGAIGVRRRYVRREVSPITGAAIPIPFDLMLESHWTSRDALLAARERGGGDPKMLARLGALVCPPFMVEDCDTPMAGWSADEDLFKQLYLLKRRPGLSRAEFRRRYEEEHVVDGARRMPQARRYLRRYVVIDEGADEADAPPFDVILEVWWGSRAESEAAIRAIAANGEMQAIRDDSEGIFASPNHPLFTVVESGAP